MLFLLLRFLLRHLFLFWWVNLYMLFAFFSLKAFNILSLFSVLVVLCFLWGGSILVSWRLPVLEWTKLSQDLGNFLLFYWIYYVTPLACTSSSSMPMILRFGLLTVTEYLHIPFTVLELLIKISSVSSLISTLSLSSEFCLPLVQVCWSGFPLYFLFD
jgi:hypothetical protein